MDFRKSVVESMDGFDLLQREIIEPSRLSVFVLTVVHCVDRGWGSCRAMLMFVVGRLGKRRKTTNGLGPLLEVNSACGRVFPRYCPRLAPVSVSRMDIIPWESKEVNSFSYLLNVTSAAAEPAFSRWNEHIWAPLRRSYTLTLAI